MDAETSALIAEAIHAGNWILGREVRGINARVGSAGEAIGDDVEGAIESVGDVQTRGSRVIGIHGDLFRVGLVRDVIEPQGVGLASGRALVAALFGGNEHQVASSSIFLSKDREGSMAALEG